MRLGEDELINAICFHIAERKHLRPEQVEAQLSWDEEQGYTCEVFAEGRSQYLVEANMLEAIERYLLNRYQKRVFRSHIRLDIDDEMFADIQD